MSLRTKTCEKMTIFSSFSVFESHIIAYYKILNALSQYLGHSKTSPAHLLSFKPKHINITYILRSYWAGELPYPPNCRFSINFYFGYITFHHSTLLIKSYMYWFILNARVKTCIFCWILHGLMKGKSKMATFSANGNNT